MIGVERVRNLFATAFENIGSGSQAQAFLGGGKEQLARIGKNEVYQNILKKEYSFQSTVNIGKKVGSHSCNRFDSESVSESMRLATQIARVQQEDPDYPGLLEANDDMVDDSYYHHPTMDAAFDLKLKELEYVFSDARSRGVEVAGAFSHGDSVNALGNSQGLLRYHVCTDASFTLSIMTPLGGTGWSEFHSHRLEDIEPRILYQIALNKAVSSENPIAIDEGEYTVILEPPAVQSLLFWLGYIGFGGLPCLEGRSFLSGKEGQKVFQDCITIVDNFQAAQSFGAPFDCEGSARQAMTLVERGVFQKPVLDRRVSKKLGSGLSTTGHALPYGSSAGPLPLNMQLMPGDQDLERMIADTRRGILVTRFFYDNVIDPQKLTLTGMTRDGTFLIEDGQLVKGLKNMRYNISIPHILNQVEAISRQTWSLRDFGRMSVPALKVSGFRFTGTSN